MSLDIICFSKLIIPWATLSENRSFLGTDNVWGLKNIRPHFGAKRLYCFYLSRACWLELRPRQLSCSWNLELIIQLLNMVSHRSQLSINFESFTSRQQEIIRKTEWIPNMGLIPNKIPLIKVIFTHGTVPRSSADGTRAMRHGCFCGGFVLVSFQSEGKLQTLGECLLTWSSFGRHLIFWLLPII